MKDEKRSFKNSGSMIGVGTAIGAAVFAATGEATWIAVGVAIGAALSWRKPKKYLLPFGLATFLFYEEGTIYIN